jgi:hypothetical protein
MAKLEWRIHKYINIADFMDTAFVIEFDGPGTYIAYLRDNQIVRKEHILEYRDAVLWCQQQADRLEEEARNAAEENQRAEQDPIHTQAEEAVFDILAEEFGTAQVTNLGEYQRIWEKLTTLVFEAHVAGLQEAHDSCADLVSDFDRDHDPESASGAHSAKRMLERRIRILNGEDTAVVDRDMNK